MERAKKKLVVKNRLRFTIFIILVFILMNILVFAFAMPDRTSADISHKTDLVYVAPGDTLWSIASTYTDGRQDIREMVYRIKKINNLSSANLAVGQAIAVPLD